MIFGEGTERSRLEALRGRLGLADVVDFPGIISNPYSAMRGASLFVLSSRREGLPTVLIEALACGCPVVSTDCHSGPDEILLDERYGLLSPVGDAAGLAEAMLAALDCPWDREALAARGASFSLDRALPEFLDALGYSIATPSQTSATTSLAIQPRRELSFDLIDTSSYATSHRLLGGAGIVALRRWAASWLRDPETLPSLSILQFFGRCLTSLVACSAGCGPPSAPEAACPRTQKLHSFQTPPRSRGARRRATSGTEVLPPTARKRSTHSSSAREAEST